MLVGAPRAKNVGQFCWGWGVEIHKFKKVARSKSPALNFASNNLI
jgi:hypothetical protein